jgi:hypothetical protein
VPWHPKKWCNFTSIFIYLGLLWDIVRHTVTLPDEKQKKYQDKLFTLLDVLWGGRRMSCKDAMSINGTLSHVSFIIPQSFLLDELF